MSLKRIEITGFKSFAERTVIDFSGPLSAIVGPNGCGKSNIVDAFLWVLGEQSAKTLRGSKMGDVIFAGTAKRKPMNVAEVTVTFCNASGFLQIPYEEVAVTRRLFQSGDSEYLINKQNVRLRDVQELFVHTGVGKEAFAVIGQGKVAELIAQSPQERRVLFEEVAGIAHFLHKRKESQKKLDLAEQNLTRAQDVFLEVDVQRGALEKQAHEAKRYQQQQKKLTQLEHALCYRQFDEQKILHEKLTKSIAAIQKELKTVEEQEKTQQTELLKKKTALQKWREEEAERQTQVHQAKNSIALIQKELSIAKEQQSSLRASLARTEKEIFSYQESLQQYLESKQKAEKALGLAEKDFAALQKDTEKAEQEWRRLQLVKESQEPRLRELNSERLRQHSQVQAFDSELAKAHLTEGMSQEKLSDYQKKIELLQEEIAVCQAESSKKKEELEQCVALVEEKKKLLTKCITSLQVQDKEIESLKKLQEGMRGQFLEVSARYKVLEKLENDFEGYSPAAKNILKEAKKQSSSLFGKIFSLADFINIEELPVADVMARLYDTTLVVHSLEDFEQCLAVCEQTKAKDLSIICLELLDMTDDGKLLWDHFAEAIIPVDDWEEVKKLLKKKGRKPLWLANGLFVDTQGVMHSSGKKEHNLFKQKNQIKELQSEKVVLEKKMAALQEQRESLEQKKSAMITQRQTLDEEMRRSDMRVVSCNFQLQAIEKQKNAAVAALEKQKGEVSGLKKSLTTLKESVTAKKAALLAAKETLNLKEEELHAFEKEIETNKKKLMSAFEERQKRVESFNQAKTDLQKQRHALELTFVKEQQTQKVQAQALEQKGRYHHRLQEVQKQDQQLKTRLTESENLFAQLKTVSGEQQELGPLLEKEIVALEELLFGFRKTKETKLSTFSSQSAQVTHVAEQLSQYKEALAQYTGNVDTELSLAAIGEIEKQCRTLKNTIEKSKNVNLMAIGEYEAILERHKFLEEQLTDLRTAKTDLVQIIQGLEKQSRKAFSRTFEVVKQAFQRNFQTLFNGGKADLILIENQDLLQAGVEIMVQPPGKQTRSMQLLSGGEKSLTALALLFSCFELHMAPFCILDEVDAALDETNVERFGRLVEAFAEKSQFLLITHNKRTMKIANALIGVSMQEQGVSQIITVDFQQQNKAKQGSKDLQTAGSSR